MLSSGRMVRLAGKILIVRRYTRALIRSQPKRLFVFGDNLARVGYGGQAAEARGELNVIGIATKRSPRSFFTETEQDFVDAKEQIVKAFVILAEHLQAGHDVVWPKDGVGTGLAELPVRAPSIWEGLEKCRKQLFSMSDGVIEYTS